ncbi:DUF4381 domain-containing protein [Thiolapillus sp.]
MNDPLAQLKDIHLPPAIGWWPPAPGWWLLALLAVGSMIWLGWYLRRRASRPNLSREAQAALHDIHAAWLEHGNDARLAGDLSALLRRMAISACPHTDVAGLTGEAWLRWLDAGLEGEAFEKGIGRVLLESAYRPDVRLEDPEALLALVRRWLEQAANSGCDHV